MTPTGRLAIGAAEQAGRVLGARAAHSALRSLVLTLADPNDRVAALLAAAKHALQLADEPAMLSLATLLASIPEADAREHRPGLTQLCARLLAERRPRLAAELARAELHRAPSAEAHYLVGRCLHRQQPAEAEVAYRMAEASTDGALRDAALHQRRLLALGRRAPAPTPREPRTTASAAPEDPRHALSDAAARLTHGGRYARALAIDQLAALSQDSAVAPPLQHAALRLLARHADERGTELSDVEIERLRAAFAGFGAPLAEALAARSRPPHDPPESHLAATRTPNDADAIATQLTRGALPEAVRTLRHARIHLTHEDSPSSLFAAAWLAAQARERAAERREPGATDALVRSLVAEAWKAYAGGDRAAALSALRRADRLDAESTAAPPPRRTTP